jgi:hypothetical protein
MRDTYQDIFANYPTLTTFGTVVADEISIIATLKKVFVKWRITVPTDAQVSAANTIAATVTSISNADAVAISLEQSTATLMTQLLQSADNQDAAGAVALIRTTSLSSHATAFTAEQTSVSTPAPAPTPTTPTQRIVPFTTSDSTSTFMTLLADETVDVVEMAAGTYHLAYMIINIDRTRPVVVRPVAGATVTMSGDVASPNGQFTFGLDGVAGNITMQGLIFDGFILGQHGIIQVLKAHDITLNDMVVRNSRCDGTTAQPYHAWAVYITFYESICPMRIVANRWTVDVSANRQMGALQVMGGSHITASGWGVTGAYYGVYASNARGPLTDFILDDWTISDTGGPSWGQPNVSVAVEHASGKVSNMHATASGVLLNYGDPMLADGGGNSR